MSAANKTALLALLRRCSKVIDEEIDNLGDWANKATSPGRSTRCTGRKARIRSGPGRKMTALLASAQATPAEKVLAAPSGPHKGLIVANERSVAARKQRNVNTMPPSAFTRHLRRAEDNSKDALGDGDAVYRDCT